MQQKSVCLCHDSPISPFYDNASSAVTWQSHYSGFLIGVRSKHFYKSLMYQQSVVVRHPPYCQILYRRQRTWALGWRRDKVFCLLLWHSPQRHEIGGTLKRKTQLLLFKFLSNIFNGTQFKGGFRFYHQRTVKRTFKHYFVHPRFSFHFGGY